MIREFPKAQKTGQIVELLFRIAKSRHNEFHHDTVTAERRCKECQFHKRAKKVLKINDDWAMDDGFQQLLDRLGGRSVTEFLRRPYSCLVHPSYAAKRKPTADCRSCREIWEARC